MVKNCSQGMRRQKGIITQTTYAEQMMTEEKWSSGVQITALLFSIFFINYLCTLKFFSGKYEIAEADMRICDNKNLSRFLFHSLFAVLSIFIVQISAVTCLEQYPISKIIISFTSICFFIIFMIALSGRAGVTEIGSLIYLEYGVFIIPYDFKQNKLLDNLFKLKFVTNSFSMEELSLKMITDVYALKDNKVLVHGSFGARYISWRNRKKRDECIAALEEACRLKCSQ